MKWLILLAGLAASPTLLAADAPTLKVGDPAPKLQTGKWLQGNPVTNFDKAKTYIVEFWATWCGPCRVSIPHLNEIYQKYKDKGLVVIGQDCWERDESLVAPFLKEMGDKMTYRVALDDKTTDKTGKMATTWMTAAGRDGIPSAFLVDTSGTIAWIGHPMELQEKVLEAVLEGKYDVRKAAAEYEQQQKSARQAEAAESAIVEALQKEKYDDALAKVDDLEKAMPEAERARADILRFGILLTKEDYPAAYKIAGKASEAHPDNVSLQDALAWQIVADPKIKQRDLALADKIADRANTAAKGKDPSVLDTMARVKFMLGKKDEAISLEQKAVALAGHDQQDSLQKALDDYKAGKLPETH